MHKPHGKVPGLETILSWGAKKLEVRLSRKELDFLYVIDGWVRTKFLMIRLDVNKNQYLERIALRSWYCTLYRIDDRKLEQSPRSRTLGHKVKWQKKNLYWTFFYPTNNPLTSNSFRPLPVLAFQCYWLNPLDFSKFKPIMVKHDRWRLNLEEELGAVDCQWIVCCALKVSIKIFCLFTFKPDLRLLGLVPVIESGKLAENGTWGCGLILWDFPTLRLFQDRWCLFIKSLVGLWVGPHLFCSRTTMPSIQPMSLKNIFSLKKSKESWNWWLGSHIALISIIKSV